MAGDEPRRASLDPDPFERLFVAEYGRVLAIAQRVVADRAEAEDVAQEVFLDFHHRHPPDAPYAPGWLHRAAAHTALNRIRSRRRRQQRELRSAALDPTPHGSQDPHDVVQLREDRRHLREALGRLPTKAASVLALRYSGLSYVEVAQALGVGTGQIGTLLRRAEAALKKEMHDATPV